MPKKYVDFSESVPHIRLAKQNPRDERDIRSYTTITCPHCSVAFVEMAVDRLSTNKASECKKHLLRCEAASAAGVLPLPVKRKKVSTVDKQDSNNMVTIYSLTFLPTGKTVYTGRTKDPARRFKSHASTGSKCRLVRDAFLKYGMNSFILVPILRCKSSDADANESYWIVRNHTLYPNGYNLRHGASAGKESTTDELLVSTSSNVELFSGIAEEARAYAEGWVDVADIMKSAEEDDSVGEYYSDDEDGNEVDEIWPARTLEDEDVSEGDNEDEHDNEVDEGVQTMRPARTLEEAAIEAFGPLERSEA